jgi:hypothetical protein
LPGDCFALAEKRNFPKSAGSPKKCGRLWQLYTELKAYLADPQLSEADRLNGAFRGLFTPELPAPH